MPRRLTAPVRMPSLPSREHAEREDPAAPARTPAPCIGGPRPPCLTGWLWLHERQGLDANLRTHFESSVRQTTGRIEQRLAACELMLRGARSLFETSSQVSADDFRRYVSVLTDGADFAGLQIMAYTPVPPGYADDAPLPIAYVAPNTPANQGAIGRDMYADPLRREAMQQARGAGIAAITRKITLLVDEVPRQPGFAMYQAKDVGRASLVFAS